MRLKSFQPLPAGPTFLSSTTNSAMGIPAEETGSPGIAKPEPSVGAGVTESASKMETMPKKPNPNAGASQATADAPAMGTIAKKQGAGWRAFQGFGGNGDPYARPGSSPETPSNPASGGSTTPDAYKSGAADVTPGGDKQRLVPTDTGRQMKPVTQNPATTPTASPVTAKPAARIGGMGKGVSMQGRLQEANPYATAGIRLASPAYKAR